MVALGWLLVAVGATALSHCSVDDRPVGVNPSGDGQAGAGVMCEGSTCVVIGPQQPGAEGCLPAGCPEDDGCRDYAGNPAGMSPDAGCITLADCPFTWKPEARGGEACHCDGTGCTLLTGAACSTSGACEGGNCVATADGTSVCCAAACAANEVCAADGSSCIAAEPCTEGRRCSGALHQSCVDGLWSTLTDCAKLGCSTELDGCKRSAGQACETDAECGEGTCLATAEGNRVCCTGACDTSCQRCSAEGTECVNLDDDEACGTIECPTDSCRTYDPATVVTDRCNAGHCATAEEACTVFQPQRADLECSATELCDAEGNCSRPKLPVLAECSSSEQCATGACVATSAGASVCCSQACADSQVCGSTGACVAAPVCSTGAVQCSGSNFQRCVAGQWVTELACGALGCSVPRAGCLASAGQTCARNADCGEGTCQPTAGGGSVCCTAVCDGDCRVCGATGTACTNLLDDADCGTIACPADTTCRDFPPNVTTNRCVAGRCGSAAQLCQGNARNAGQSCSATNLCDTAGNCSLPKKGNGQACAAGSECSSNNCVDGVCCNGACNGVCETCATTGICRAATTDTQCGPVTCSNFDAACVSDRTNTTNACVARGQCRTVNDCGFRSSNTRCGDGGLCDGQGNCEGPSVECGNQTCSGDNACCSMLDFNTGNLTVQCGVGDNCTFPNGGFGPTMQIFCDQNADCTGNDVCCITSTNVNSGDVRCRPVCTAQAVGAELGAPPEMLVVGQLCASQVGSLVLPCPGGQSCTLSINSLPPQFLGCR
ncbi:MAG TPA: hypothetical protein VMG12_05915 [Polyangiaceae bacterium]|nr:hypothetical protein [Polyangiaceae bacterium]